MRVLKKLSNIFLLVGGILAFVDILGCIGTAIGAFIMASPQMTDQIVEWINEGKIHSSIDVSPEQLAQVIQVMCVVVGVGALLSIALYIVCGCLCLKSRKAQTKGLYIANIILGCLCGETISVVGAVFGLITRDRE